MSLEWPISIEKNKFDIKRIQVSTLAYADDTTWIAGSKNTLQSIINISNEFFELNDIEINSLKLEVIAWRPNNKIQEPEEIQIGTQPRTIEVKKIEESTRFLSV